MSGFLLDTHIWLWRLRSAPQLPAGLRVEIDEGNEPLWLSPISVWEVGLLQRRGRIDLGRPFGAWVEEALAKLHVRHAVFTHEVAVVEHRLDLHRDPADRLLAATAVVYDLTLLTVDPLLTSRDWLPTRSA